MPARRFYCPDLGERRLALDEEQSAHARRVLRLDTGDHVDLFDGAGVVATGRIAGAGKRLTVEVIEREERARLRPWIDLAVAVPKGGRADGVVEKASELGADELIPVRARRGVVEPGRGKQRRFERIAIASGKQCGRAWLLRIAPPTDLSRLLKETDHDLKLIADARASPAITAADLVEELRRAERALVLIGPEGGWTGRERRTAQDAGFRPWRLGPHTLRVETAAAAALAILRHHS